MTSLLDPRPPTPSVVIPKKVSMSRPEPFSRWMVPVVLVALAIVAAVGSTGFLEADELTHFLNSKKVWSDWQALLSIWGRLGCTALYAPGAWLAASLPIFMVEGFYLLLTHADVLLLRQYRSPDEVAVYYAAAKTLALVAFVSFSVSAATAHKFSEYHVAGNKAQLSVFLADSIKWTFWPSLAATVVILALGKPILWLFGPQFVDGYYLMFILAFGPLARATVGPVERLLNMVGEQRACALVYAAAFATNILICVALIPFFSVAGAAIAISAAMILESVLLFWVTKMRLGLHVFIWRPKQKT